MDYRDRWELKDYLIGQTLERRIWLFQIGVILLLVGFLLNFWYLQGVHGEEYSDLAENNRLRRIPSLATRGTIFDRGSAALAATRPSLDLVVLREDAEDLETQLRRLVPILATPYEELLERLERGGGRPAYEPLVLREDVRLEELARIEARRERFPALQVRETARRSYVHGDLFAHVIGYVGEVADAELDAVENLRLGDIVGKTGLERGYDSRLRGQRGWDLVSVNALGRRIGSAWVGREPSHGTHSRADPRSRVAARAALGARGRDRGRCLHGSADGRGAGDGLHTGLRPESVRQRHDDRGVEVDHVRPAPAAARPGHRQLLRPGIRVQGHDGHRRAGVRGTEPRAHRDLRGLGPFLRTQPVVLEARGTRGGRSAGRPGPLMQRVFLQSRQADGHRADPRIRLDVRAGPSDGDRPAGRGRGNPAVEGLEAGSIWASRGIRETRSRSRLDRDCWP